MHTDPYLPYLSAELDYRRERALTQLNRRPRRGLRLRRGRPGSAPSGAALR